MQVAQSPAASLAAQVRNVLENSGSEGAWQSLADGLPVFAVREGADLPATLEAARLAEEMGASAAATAAANQPSAFDDLIWSAMSMADEVIPWAVGVVAVLVLVSLARSALKRRHRPTRRPRTAESAVPQTAVVWRRAHALAAHGMPVREISYRTRMSREAVDALLRIRT
jgi:hypothetical protein